MTEAAEWSLQAGSLEELRHLVAPLARPLPRNRHGRRDKKITERWILANWILRGQIDAFWQSYPVVLTQPDRPDFVLSDGTHSLGVEVCEITGRSTEQAQVIAETEGIDCYHWLGPDDNDRPMPTDELRQVMRKGGGGWNGADPARAFLALTETLFYRKVEKFKGYQASSKTLLLLYDDCGIPFSWEESQDREILDRLPFLFRHSGAYAAVCLLSDETWRVYDAS